MYSVVEDLIKSQIYTGMGDTRIATGISCPSLALVQKNFDRKSNPKAVNVFSFI